MTSVEPKKPIVVVGIDGSPNSATALRWASQYATMAGAELHVVTAWQSVAGFGFAPISPEDYGREAEQSLERTVHKVLGPNPSVNVTSQVVNGNPAAVLIAASRDADLLVVGDRGYEGFAGLLLGHVGENCARNAHCSVVVVRDHSE